MKDLHMKNLGNLKFGVELDSRGKVLNDAQGMVLKAANSLALAGLLALGSIALGIFFKQSFIASPLLMIFGYITSLTLLLGALAGTAIWWFITGAKTPLEFIYSSLMSGSDQMRAAVCLMPFFVLVFVILYRAYHRIYVTKVLALVITLALVASIVGLGMWLGY